MTTYTPDELQQQVHAARPRLLMPADGWNRIRANVDASADMQRWVGYLRARADELTDRPTVVHDPEQPTWHTRMLMERALTLAVMYRLDGNDAYLKQVALELASAATEMKWGQRQNRGDRYVLSNGEAAAACSLAVDWLWDALDTNLRDSVLDAIAAKALEPAMIEYGKPFGQRYWPDRNNNWNQVCNGGAIVGALCAIDRHPDLATSVINHAVASLPRAMAEFAPDGGWEEGPMYWRYGTLWNCMALASLESALGRPHPLCDMPGFDRTAEFWMHTLGPSGLMFNYSDCSPLLTVSPQLFWFASRFNRPDVAAFERMTIDWLAKQQLAMPTTHEHGVAKQPIHPLDIVWYDPTCDLAAEADAAPWPLDSSFALSEVATMRGSWTDSDATFVAFKGGKGKRAHANLDAGSFVLDALGERWAVDLGGESYSVPGYFEAWHGSAFRHFSYYRTRPEGHNTLVINPHIQPQQAIDPIARITRQAGESDHAYAVCDLSPVYEQQARSVLRGVALIDDRSRVLIQDEVHSEHAVDFWWFMHTTADVELLDDGAAAMLTLGSKRLHAQLLTQGDSEGSSDVAFSVMDARPMVQSPDPEGQNHNEGVRKLTVHWEVAVNPTVVVLLSPLQPGQAIPDNASRGIEPLATWF